MTAASRPQVVTLRSGDVVRVRQVRPGDAAALARAYANLGEESRYRRFFTVLPELPESTLKAAVEVDHENHEAHDQRAPAEYRDHRVRQKCLKPQRGRPSPGPAVPSGRPGVVQLQRRDRDAIRHRPADDARAEMASHHTGHIVGDIVHVLDRECAQHDDQDRPGEPGGQRHSGGRHRVWLRAVRITKTCRYLPYLGDRPTGGHASFRYVLSGLRLAPGYYLQRGGCVAGRGGEAIADRERPAMPSWRGSPAARAW